MTHFENLWEECERHHGEITSDNIDIIISELQLKIDLLKKIIKSNHPSNEDLKKIKSHSLGEILYTLTKISLKENINVYESLKMSLEYRR